MTSGATHERLVDRARHGDSAAFAALYEELAPRVLRFLCHQVGEPDLAEELMQMTFVKVIEALPRFELRRGIPFSAWVFRVARNLAIDERRTAHPHQDLADAPEVASDEPDPEQIAVAGSQRDELIEALERLPADQHDVIVYRFFGDLSPSEVAPLMHRSDGAIRVLQHRALRHLRELMTPAHVAHVVARAES